MRNVTTAAAALCACFTLLTWARTAPAAPAGKDPLEGKWAVTVSPEDGGGKPYDDTVTVTRGGKLTSAKLSARGFAEADCETDSRGGQAVTFTAEHKDKAGNTAKWTGTASLGELTGTLTVTTNGNAVTYTIKGKRADK